MSARHRLIRPSSAVGLVALAVVGLAACGDSDSTPATSAPATTTPVTTAPSTTEATTTTPTTTPATTTAPATTAPAPSTTAGAAIPVGPEAYAVAFVKAWERGDQAAAAVLSTPDALASAFSQEGGGAGTWSLEGCEGAAGSSYCTFGAGGDPKVIVRVANEAASLGQPDAVTEVRFEG